MLGVLLGAKCFSRKRCPAITSAGPGLWVLVCYRVGSYAVMQLCSYVPDGTVGSIADKAWLEGGGGGNCTC